MVLLAKPEGISADLDFSKRVVDRGGELLAQQDLSKYGADFHTDITGTFQKKLDQQKQIGRDIAVSSAVAGVLLLLYLCSTSAARSRWRWCWRRWAWAWRGRTAWWAWRTGG